MTNEKTYTVNVKGVLFVGTLEYLKDTLDVSDFLGVLKNDAKLNAEGYGDQIITSLLSGVSEQRQKAWPVKGRIAADIIKGNAIPAEVKTVQDEIDERGDGRTVEEMAAIHLAKSVALLSVNNLIEGMLFKVNRAIDTSESEEELNKSLAEFREYADIKKKAILEVFNK